MLQNITPPRRLYAALPRVDATRRMRMSWRATRRQATRRQTILARDLGILVRAYTRRMIHGAHVIIYSKDAEADRAFLRDVLKYESVDAGHGWLIFALPPAE